MLKFILIKTIVGEVVGFGNYYLDYELTLQKLFLFCCLVRTNKTPYGPISI